jgi:uncharacterized protein (DUF362 family)
MAGFKTAIHLRDGLRFLKPGERILIKPTVNSVNPFLVNTCPLMIKALIKVLSSGEDVLLSQRLGVDKTNKIQTRDSGIGEIEAIKNFLEG